MRERMNRWLSLHQMTFDADTAHSVCGKFGLEGEKADECIGLCYQLEMDKITQAEFAGGLCVLTGKEPEEVMMVLKDVKPEAVSEVTPTPEEQLEVLAIKRDPVGTGRKLGYEIHKLSPRDVVDKGDYAEGYRYRIGTYPNIFMAKNEKEIADYILGQARRVEVTPTPITEPVVTPQQKYGIDITKATEAEYVKAGLIHYRKISKDVGFPLNVEHQRRILKEEYVKLKPPAVEEVRGMKANPVSEEPTLTTQVKTYYHESPYADKILAEGFNMEIERRSDPGDFGWGVYLWITPQYMSKGYTLEVDVDISRFAVIHDSYTPVNPYEIKHDTPDEALFRELAFGTNRWDNEVMATIHPVVKNGEEWSRERTSKYIRDTFLKRGVQGFITYHNHHSIEEIVIFDLSAIEAIRKYKE